MTREEAIKILDPETTAEALAEVEYYGGFSGGTAKVQAVSDACVLAVAALQEQEERENPKPLTLEELRRLDGDKIYIQFVGACKDFYDDEYAPYYGKYEQYVQEYNGMLRACDLPLKFYGKTWLAYRSKPKE